MLIEFTDKDGGIWKTQHFDITEKYFRKELAKCKTKKYIGSICNDKLDFVFHSLKFSNGEEWDSYNGWRGN